MALTREGPGVQAALPVLRRTQKPCLVVGSGRTRGVGESRAVVRTGPAHSPLVWPGSDGRLSCSRVCRVVSPAGGRSGKVRSPLLRSAAPSWMLLDGLPVLVVWGGGWRGAGVEEDGQDGGMPLETAFMGQGQLLALVLCRKLEFWISR